MNRRDFLKAMLIGGATLGTNAPLIHQTLAQSRGQFMPQGKSAVMHAIARVTYGITLDLHEASASQSPTDFIDQQLAPATIDDHALDALLADNPLLQVTSADVYRDDISRRRLISTITVSTLMRKFLSHRSLYEMMVEFWHDHFNVFIGKGQTYAFFIPYDRDAIRPHALGRFRDLLGAVAKHTAMLYYLDNVHSRRRDPNENFAREMLELHTLGVNNYSETDIAEVARIFTGWSMVRIGEDPDRAGDFRFRARIHDNGRKTVLGHTFEGDGEAEGDYLLDLLASRPETGRLLARKLVRRFVADDAPADLVEAVASTFISTEGDIKAMFRTIFESDHFWEAPPKFKRPQEYAISIMRALDYQIRNDTRFYRDLADELETMGHLPFQWHAPNGYPDANAYWMQNLLPRWNLAKNAVEGNQQYAPNYERLVALVDSHNQRPIQVLAHYFLGRELSRDEQRIIDGFLERIEGDSNDKVLATIALLIASPAFQSR